jgi:hypothetical protein
VSESPPVGSRVGFAARFASRGQPVIRFGLVALAVWTVLRAVLIATFVEPAFRVAALAAMVTWGLPFDLLTVATMLLPGLLAVALFRAHWLFTVTARVACAWLATAVLVFDAAVQFFFFEEYQARYNHLALDYIAYPHEVLGNIAASYDVRTVVALAVVAGGVLALAQVWRARPIAPVWPARDRLRAAACVVGLAALLAVAWRLTPQPALADRVAAETARNGWPELARAYLTAHLDYDAYYLQVPAAEARTRLSRLLPQPDPGRGLIRHFAPRRTAGSRPLDVAIIMEESLGSEFSTRFGGSPGALTPELDRWSHEGIAVVDLMATGNRTVRGLEGVLCSFPPLPGDAIVKGDASTGLATVPAVLHARGYRTVFLYGGRGIFDNLETFMLANGFEAFVGQSIFRPPTSAPCGASPTSICSTRCWTSRSRPSGAGSRSSPPPSRSRTTSRSACRRAAS